MVWVRDSGWECSLGLTSGAADRGLGRWQGPTEAAAADRCVMVTGSGRKLGVITDSSAWKTGIAGRDD